MKRKTVFRVFTEYICAMAKDNLKIFFDGGGGGEEGKRGKHYLLNVVLKLRIYANL